MSKPLLSIGRKAGKGALLAVLLASSALTGVYFASPARQAHADSTPAPATAAEATLAPLSHQGALPPSFADLVSHVSPAVVTVSTTQVAKDDSSDQQMPEGLPPGMEEFFRRFGMPQGGQEDSGPAREVHALGSGFIIDPKGYIVTNNHVIEDAKEITVTLDKKDYKATLVGRDPKTDLAVLKIDADHALPYLEFGDSTKARVGDWVIAIGNPFGLGGTVTAGIVSARGRDIHSGPYDDFLQIDASINRGNSGGPAIDAAGQVIGVNSAIYTPNGGSIGIGFAIPSSLAKPVVEKLIHDGKVDRGWLGVQIQPVTPEMTTALGLDDAKGALVVTVDAKSPAGKAGLKPGDVITRFDKTDIDDLRDLTRAVANTTAGNTVDMKVMRDSKPTTIAVTVAEAPDDQQVADAGSAATGHSDALGLDLAGLNDDARHKLGLDSDVSGVLVRGASQKAPEGIQPGDVILRVDSKTVESPKELASAVHAAREDGRKSVLLLVLHRGQQGWLVANLDAS
jgi:serine protease Do